MNARIVIGFPLLLGALNLPCFRAPDARMAAETLIDAGGKLAARAPECKKLSTQQVAFEEEKALGSAVALNLAKAEGGMWVDAPANAGDIASFNAKVNGPTMGNVTFPSTPRNALNRYLNKLGRQLALHSSRPDISWTFGVIDGATENAVSTPGGYIFVTRGLLKKLTSEAQLAGVLAHEIAHVTERHSLKAYSDAKANQCYIALGVSIGAGVAKDAVSDQNSWVKVLDNAGALDLDAADVSGELIAKLVDDTVGRLLASGRAREDELGADEIAVELMVLAGFNPGEYVSLVKGLPEGTPIVSHHPKNAERVETMEKHLTKFAAMSPDSLPKGDVSALKAASAP
jgi:predicted Zn-dependent protease